MEMALNVLPNNPMNFTENQLGGSILEKLKQQKEQGRFCDVTFYVDGRQYSAHRNVLASCSPYFNSVLKTQSSMREGLTIACVKPDDFNCLLNYMYTGSIVIDKNNVTELLKLANHFLVTKLRNYCAEYLDRYLDVTNCLSVRELAEKYNMPSLLKAATMFIKMNLTEVVFQEEILYYPLKKIEAFLSDEAWCVPCNMLLNLIARWISQDIVVRERSMKVLLTFIDWHRLDVNTIADHLDREPLYASSEVSLYFILQSLAENNLLIEKYRGIFQALQEKIAQQPMSDCLEKCSSISDSSINIKNKLVLKRPHKPKLWGVQPGARLSALKAALSAQRRRVNIYRHPTYKYILERYSCHLCSHVAPSLCFLEQHVAIAHCKSVTYKCGMCGYMCQWNEEYLTHMKGHFQGPPFKCGSCKFTCDEVKVFLAHHLKHSVNNFSQYGDCGYQCNNNSDSTLHKLCRTSSPPYKCESCGKHFNLKSSLERHLLTHGADRPYLCDTCGFSTKHLSLLIAHKRIHSEMLYQGTDWS